MHRDPTRGDGQCRRAFTAESFVALVWTVDEKVAPLRGRDTGAVSAAETRVKGAARAYWETQGCQVRPVWYRAGAARAVES